MHFSLLNLRAAGPIADVRYGRNTLGGERLSVPGQIFTSSCAGELSSGFNDLPPNSYDAEQEEVILTHNGLFSG
jgi:hypothetical protein